MYIKKLLDGQTIGNAHKMDGCSDGLSEVYHEFINPAACGPANPYSGTFWQELKGWLESVSKRAEGYPAAIGYRAQLAPYCLRRANLLAESWSVVEVFDHTMRLCLTDVRLAHVRGRSVGCAPNVYIDHINLLVSSFWFDRIAPSQDEGLSVNGMLYEYINSKNQRNIGVMGVVVMPRSRRTAGVRTLPELDREYAA